MNRRPEAPRAVRGAVFAVVAVWLAAMAHASAGGALPDPAVMVTAGGLLAFAAAGAARKIRRLPEIGGALLTAQVLLHLLFAVAGHHGGAALPVGSMLVAHVVAAAVSAVVMAGAEAAAARVRRGYRRLLGLLAPDLPAVERGWSVRRPAHSGTGSALEVVNLRRRRGPPILG